jgi:hypothetical protein
VCRGLLIEAEGELRALELRAALQAANAARRRDLIAFVNAHFSWTNNVLDAMDILDGAAEELRRRGIGIPLLSTWIETHPLRGPGRAAAVQEQVAALRGLIESLETELQSGPNLAAGSDRSTAASRPASNRAFPWGPFRRRAPAPPA